MNIQHARSLHIQIFRPQDIGHTSGLSGMTVYVGGDLQHWAIPDNIRTPPIEEIGFPDFFPIVRTWISRLFF